MKITLTVEKNGKESFSQYNFSNDTDLTSKTELLEELQLLADNA